MTFGWLLLVAFGPTLLTLAGLAWCAADGRRPAPPLHEPAGPFVERAVRKLRADVRVEIVTAETPDAYWPNVGVIGISERTYGGTAPRDWAIAAHELGHALNIGAHPALPALLPAARIVSTLGWRLCIGGLLAAAMFGGRAAMDLAFVALIAAVVGSAIVCADEITASNHAAALLRREKLDREAIERAVTAMRAAGSAYVLGGVGQLAVLAAWPALSAAITSDPDSYVRPPSWLGIWLVLAITPVIVLRTGLAVWQFLRPEPVPTELDLWALLGREARWESVCGVGMVAVIATMHPAIQGPVAAVSTALALAVAIGPVQALGAALVALPVVVARRVRRERPRNVRYLKPARDDVPEAMIAMWADPPWYLRATWLMPLAYLPLVGVLAVRVAWF